MKKWFVSMLVVIMMLLGACAEETTTQQTTNNSEEVTTTFPVTVEDATGKEVTLEQAPTKIVSMIQSNTEILFGLGLNDEIVAVNDFDNYPEEAATKEKIGSMEFNVEKMIALQPDIVFAHEAVYGFEAGIEQLEAVGIKVFVVKNAITFDETYETIKQIGQLTGKAPEAEKVTKDIKQQLADIQDKLKDQPAKSAFLLVGATPDLYAAGSKTFMDEMLKTINVKNVVTAEGWPQYSAEDFVASNPDTIIVTYEEDIATIKNNKAFAEMSAIKNDHLKVIDGDTTSRQGPRLAEGVESVAKAMYPEVFGE